MERKSYRRLFIVRKDLNMSEGKLSAQISHCAEEWWISIFKDGLAFNHSHQVDYLSTIAMPADIAENYVFNGITKTVCRAKNLNDLMKARKYSVEAGLREGEDFGFIRDACRTELVPENEDGSCTTCFWTKPIPDEIAHEISKHYQLY